MCDGVSNHQPHDCLLNRSFRRISKKTSKLRVTGLCARNSPVTGEFPAQMVSNVENVSIWWRHYISWLFSFLFTQTLPYCFTGIAPITRLLPCQASSSKWYEKNITWNNKGPLVKHTTNNQCTRIVSHIIYGLSGKEISWIMLRRLFVTP